MGSTFVASRGVMFSWFCSSDHLFSLSPGKESTAVSNLRRREVVLRSFAVPAMAAIFNFSGAKPGYLGVQKNSPSLALCPATSNCVSTSEDISDSKHYAPPCYNVLCLVKKLLVSHGFHGLLSGNQECDTLYHDMTSGNLAATDSQHPQDLLLRNYNGQRKKPIGREEAMAELLQVLASKKPDKFTPRVVEKKNDYVRVEYESPIFGFVDDVEFWFPPGKKSLVEYRSASRSGNFDFDVNRKRIKALREELEKKGWASESSF